VFVGLAKYGAYQNKFSDKDYAAIEEAAGQVFSNVGASGIKKYEYCSYEAPEKYSSVRLYCGIEMAAYMPYENDTQAIQVAGTLEREIKKLGSTISDISTFYSDPTDTLTGVTVTFAYPLPKRQCNFTIASHKKAKDISSFLPKRTEDNLIALAFDCTAQSREEYFPVTYRQGS